MTGIVQDGQRRYALANAEALEQRWRQRKAEIEGVYAEKLERASAWRRLFLRLRMRRNLRRARLELEGYGSLYSRAQGQISK